MGRISEIDKLSDLIKTGTKIVSIVGEGGIGKTSLSTKVVRKVENLFEIIIPVNLARDTAFKTFLLEVGNFINSSYINSLDTSDIDVLLREIFASVGKILLYVDNYENVADFIDGSYYQDLRKIHHFLETLPTNVTIIVNSRNRLNLEGETSIILGGLSSQDAVDLFVQMAKNHLQNPIPTEILSKIKEICNMVNGHPLSIKLLGGAYKGGGINRLEGLHNELFSSIKSMREHTDRHISD